MKIKEIIKKYGTDKEHLENVSRLCILFFEKIKPYFPILKIYDNQKDISLLKYGGLLHDIGIYFEESFGVSHHKAGAEFILQNKPYEVEEQDLKVLCCLIRYHRKSMPDEKKHKIYKDLNKKDKDKVKYLGSIIKFCDALDSFHINMIEDFRTEFDGEKRTLTLFFNNNIMFNKSVQKALNKKKDFFESVYSIKLQFKGE